MPMKPCGGTAAWMRQRKSCASSSRVGCLNDVTRTPCGFTPVKTCLTVPSLPPASIACRTTSSARRDSAYSRSCSGASSSCSPETACRVAFLSPGAPFVSPGSRSASENGRPGGAGARGRAGRGRAGGGTGRRRGCSSGDPVVAPAVEVEVLGAVVGDDAEDGLVVLGARLVDDLHEQQLADLGAGPLGECG